MDRMSRTGRGVTVQVHATMTVAPVVRSLRTRYRQEMNCQIVKHSIHTPAAWAMTYALGLEATLVGFRTVAIAGPRAGNPPTVSVSVLPGPRARASYLWVTIV